MTNFTSIILPSLNLSKATSMRIVGGDGGHDFEHFLHNYTIKGFNSLLGLLAIRHTLMIHLNKKFCLILNGKFEYNSQFIGNIVVIQFGNEM